MSTPRSIRQSSPRPRLQRYGLLFALSPLFGCGNSDSDQMMPAVDLDAFKVGLTASTRQDYVGQGDGGLLHITYWTIKAGSPEYMALSMVEQGKLAKMQASVLHSAQLTPKDLIAGTEITGTLDISDSQGDRKQEIVFKFPKDWNGSLVVVGTPAARTEFSNEALLAPWLVKRGYAYISGNKGMTNGGADGNTTLLGKTHITQYWGLMMHDLAAWAATRLQAATGKAPAHVYTVGLSNGGYQVRRALEIDHQRVKMGQPRQFDGGVAWAGVYWPDARVLDRDHNGTVTPAEYAAATHLVSSQEQAALAMGYPYDASPITTPAGYAQNPQFSLAQPGMRAAGFTAQSSLLWGAYSLLFDALKTKVPAYQGIGYYNLTAYYYRADLLGDDATSSAPYSIWAVPGGARPPFYDYVAKQTDGGWTADSVSYALRNATTGEFSAPLISLHGDRDALIGLVGHGQAYDDAVRTYGMAALHRLYIIQNGNHVDQHADGTLDYNCNGTPGDEGAGDLLTPMQPYVEHSFDSLVDWVEQGMAPSASQIVTTDPRFDILDAQKLNF